LITYVRLSEHQRLSGRGYQYQNGEQEMTEEEVIAESPCVGDCQLDDKGICQCCFLAAVDNDRWNSASNQERLVMVQQANERKKAAGA
jgi:predicted Fe-S protein YdhL (DUF1289 family)